MCCLLGLASGCGSSPATTGSVATPAAATDSQEDLSTATTEQPPADTDGDTAGDEATAGNRACSILSKAKAETILGKPVEEAQASSGGATGELCDYYEQGVPAGTGGNISLSIVADDEEAEITFDALAEVDGEPVAGLGDKAAIHTEGGDGFLVVRKENDVFKISVSGGAQAVRAKSLRTLAEEVLAQIEG